MPLLVIIMLFLSGSGIAQEQPQLNANMIDTRHGLPSSSVYQTFQDSKGFMWFATDKGVARYNGYDFESYSSEDGLTNNDVFTIQEDPTTGDIWFNTFSGGACYYDGTGIYPHPLNDQIKEILDQSWMSSFGIDSMGNFWFTSSNRKRKVIDYNFYKIPPTHDTILAISPNATACVNISNGRHYVKYVESNLVLNAGSIGHSPNDLSVEYTDTTKLKNPFLQTNLGKIISLGEGRAVLNGYVEIIEIQKDSLCYYSDNEKFRIREMNAVGYDSDKEYRFICTSNGVLVLDKWHQVIDHFLKDTPVFGMLKDKDGNYWFSTYNSGVIVVRSLDIKQYLTEHIISHIQFGNDSILLIATHDHKAYELKYDSTYNSFTCKSIELENIPPYLGSNDSWDRNSVLLSKYRNSRSLKSVYWPNGRYVFFGGADGFQMVDVKGKTLIYDSAYRGFNRWIRSILFDQYNRYWFGTTHGLFLKENLDDIAINIGARYPKLETSIADVTEVGNNLIIVATDGNGLVFMEKDSINYLTQKDGLSSNFINTILIENDSSVWVGTNQGLNHLIGDLRKPKIDYYNASNGFPLNDIRILRLYKEHLIVGGRKGVTVLPKIHKEKELSYQTYLDHIEVNNLDVEPRKAYEFNYDENNIVFHFRTLRFNKLHVYEYRLIGLDTAWQKGIVNSIRYQKLRSGHYIFEARAPNSVAMTIPFSIHPHFTETWLFKGLMISLGIVIIVIIVFFIFKILHHNEQIERKMGNLEYKALRSQMNPHFIFNAMNSIMFLILNNKSKAARRYLLQFSKLMRFVLENSKYNFITVKDELLTLKAYIEIEQLRYGDEVVVHWDIAPDLRQSKYKIPPMLLQPVIENALMHGLAAKPTTGNLWLRFVEDQDVLCISIEDDGIGREAARKLAAQRTVEDHQKSSAIKNIDERISHSRFVKKNISFQKRNVNRKFFDKKTINSIHRSTRKLIEDFPDFLPSKLFRTKFIPNTIKILV